MMISQEAIRKKFGDDYTADERTFIMGIDERFTSHFAKRFSGSRVLETCSGAGFTTISLARAAARVITVEIHGPTREKAMQNVLRAGLSERVSFVSGDILDPGIIADLPMVDAVFMDPDWAVTGPGHIYRFRNATTEPPADLLLEKMLAITKNVAMVLPPFIDTREFEGLPPHELERLYLQDSHELFCLYFGDLARAIGTTEFRVKEPSALP
ncbi:hypothetical protein [Desulfoluna spongiiphila]|uniref:hypothetical protein n=1 Tax=Desulfoluna spongiiphila TaxID=419481 RepID=UPI0012523CA5|nr:hypothetical protein [Desulfoluna spongiiphila]VVS90970.1 rna cap guanine-n2 methyltransferase [Desulfoluna spongiiphila]